MLGPMLIEVGEIPDFVTGFFSAPLLEHAVVLERPELLIVLCSVEHPEAFVGQMCADIAQSLQRTGLMPTSPIVLNQFIRTVLGHRWAQGAGRNDREVDPRTHRDAALKACADRHMPILSMTAFGIHPGSRERAFYGGLGQIAGLCNAAASAVLPVDQKDPYAERIERAIRAGLHFYSPAGLVRDIVP